MVSSIASNMISSLCSSPITHAKTGSRPARLEIKRRRKWVTMTPLFSWEGTTSMEPRGRRGTKEGKVGGRREGG